MTSESTRFLGQPREIKPTEGAVGAKDVVTFLLYRAVGFGDSGDSRGNQLCSAATICSVERTRPRRGKMRSMELAWLSAVRPVMASSAKTSS